MSGYSGLDFSSVGAELAYWLTHISQAFKGGFAGSGENGYDFAIPHGTPVYAILPGRVVGAGYYGGGGVVSVQYNAQNVVYYQHLDLNQVSVGDQISVGQQLGLSGGQLSGGNHPATCCSGGDHIEVGLNAPFGGMWNPNNVKPNANPIGLLNSLNKQYQANNVAVGGSGGKSGGNIVGLVGTTTGKTTPAGTCSHPIVIAGAQVGCVPDTVYNWITEPIRLLKLGAGVILVAVAALLFIVPPLIGPATEVAGIATGQPEVAAIGGAISNARGGKARSNVTITKQAQPRQVNLKSKYAAPQTQRFGTDEEPPSGGIGVDTGPLGPDIPPSRQRRAPTTKPLGGNAAPPGTAGFEQQQQAAQAAQNIDDLQRRSDEAYQKANDQTRSAGERRFWRNAALDLERQIKAAGGKPTMQPTPAPKAPAGPEDTYALGAKTVVSKTPIPDKEVLQTKADIHTFMGSIRDFISYRQGQKTAEQQRQKRANMTPEETAKALGLSGRGGTQKVPGTEVSLEGEQASLKSLEQLLTLTTDPKVRADIERDIAATKARIAKLQQKKGGA